MNHINFDRLSQTAADPSLLSRRGVLAALGIAVLGVIAGVDADGASAKRKTRPEARPKSGHHVEPANPNTHARLFAAKRKKRNRKQDQRHGQERQRGGATTPPPGDTDGGCESQPKERTCSGTCGLVSDNCGLQVDCGDTCSGVETCGGGGTANSCGCTSQPESVTCSGNCGNETDNCGRLVDCGTCPTGGCFIAGTRVRMADGSDKPIEQVEPGDRVLGRGGKVNRVRGVLYPLLGDRPLYALNGGTAFVTSSHPFLTTDGWKAVDPEAARMEVPGLPISQLRVGDVLLSVTISRASGRDTGRNARDRAMDAQVQEHEIPLRSLEGRPADATTQLYNLDVDGDDTYVANGLVVHNKAR